MLAWISSTLLCSFSVWFIVNVQMHTKSLTVTAWTCGLVSATATSFNPTAQHRMLDGSLGAMHTQTHTHEFGGTWRNFQPRQKKWRRIIKIARTPKDFTHMQFGNSSAGNIRDKKPQNSKMLTAPAAARQEQRYIASIKWPVSVALCFAHFNINIIYFLSARRWHRERFSGQFHLFLISG